MNRVLFATASFSIGVLFLAGTAHAAGLKEGQWSMTTTIHMDGKDDEMAKAQKEMEDMSPEDRAVMEQMMGGMGMRMGAQGGGMGMTISTTQCITNDNPVPKGKDEENCESTHTISGNTVNFETVCKDSRSTGEITYKNDSMRGTIQSTTTKKGQTQNSTLDISGEYVGPCAVESEAVSSRARHPSAQEVRKLGTSGEGTGQDGGAAENDAEDNGGTTKKVFGGMKALLGR